MNCPNCGNPLDGQTRFCPVCGTAVTQAPIAAPVQNGPVCPGCGAEVAPGMAFCELCGTALGQSGGTGMPKKKGPGLNGLLDKVKKLPKAVLFGAAGAVALIVVAVILISIFSGSGGSGRRNHALYWKDGELMATDGSKSVIELTDRMEGRNGIDCVLTENGNRLFYPDRLEGDGFTLYYRDLNKKKGEPAKIDTGVEAFSINASGTKVVYIDSEDTLYYHDLKDKTKISADVNLYRILDDMSAVLFMTYEGDLYYWNAKKDAKEKLATEVAEYRLSPDASLVYYIKDETLYVDAISGGKKEKLAKDAYSILRVFDGKKVYFVQTNEEMQEVPVLDYVKNDSALTSDVRELLSDVTFWTDYYTLSYYDGKSTQTVTEAYAYDSENYTDEAMYLRVFDPERMEKVSVEDYYYIDDLQNDLSEMAESARSYALVRDGELIFTMTNEAMGLSDDEYPSHLRMDEAGKTIAYLVCEEGEDEGTLYRASVSSKGLGTPKVVDEDVSTAALRASDDLKTLVYWKDLRDDEGELWRNGKLVDEDVADDWLYYTEDLKTLVYMKDVRDDEGELWRDGKQVDDDVAAGWIYTLDDLKTLMYFKDIRNDEGELCVNGKVVAEDVYVYSLQFYNDHQFCKVDWDDYEYTLTRIKGSKAKDVAEDVVDYDELSSGKILYIADWSDKKGEGTLFVWNNGRPRELDDEVECFHHNIYQVTENSVNNRYGY